MESEHISIEFIRNLIIFTICWKKFELYRHIFDGIWAYFYRIYTEFEHFQHVGRNLSFSPHFGWTLSIFTALWMKFEHFSPLFGWNLSIFTHIGWNLSIKLFENLDKSTIFSHFRTSNYDFYYKYQLESFNFWK